MLVWLLEVRWVSIKMRELGHTDIRVIKDHEGIDVVDPFDSESALKTFPIFEYKL